MHITKLKSKIHNIAVHDTKVHYHGSCLIGHELMENAEIACYEQIHVYNIDNGERFITYAIIDHESKENVTILGAAAHLTTVGDHLIICTYALVDSQTDQYPRIVKY